MKALAKRYTARAKKMLGTLEGGTRKASPYSLRSATQRFLKDVQKVGADGVDGANHEIVRAVVENDCAIGVRCQRDRKSVV